VKDWGGEEECKTKDRGGEICKSDVAGVKAMTRAQGEERRARG
jgi:hypothetical protein